MHNNEEQAEGLLGLAPETVIVVDGCVDLREVDLWVVESHDARHVYDRVRNHHTIYPLRPQDEYDSRVRVALPCRPPEAPVVGTTWSWREVLPEVAANDPWGGIDTHEVGPVLAVRGVLL